MFPLGTVLLPGMALPLRVFEPRYRQMLDDLAAGRFASTDEFAVVLIERGSEVGGGDQRVEVGCTARITDIERYADGSAELLAVGDRVIRVVEWLPDDPFPIARTAAFPPDGPTGDASVAQLDAARSAVGAVLALAFELRLTDHLGLPELDDDPAAQVFQMALMLPLGPADRQRILSSTSTSDGLTLIEAMAAEQSELLRARLGR